MFLCLQTLRCIRSNLIPILMNTCRNREMFRMIQSLNMFIYCFLCFLEQIQNSTEGSGYIFGCLPSSLFFLERLFEPALFGIIVLCLILFMYIDKKVLGDSAFLFVFSGLRQGIAAPLWKFEGLRKIINVRARVLAASFCAVLAAARPARLALQGRKQGRKQGKI